MIAYDLQCANGHAFEGWFEDGQAYIEQNEKGLIVCPICNDTSIYKKLSTFAIKSSNSSVKEDLSIEDLHAKQMALGKMEKQIVEYIENTFDDVGTEFSNEALKIHYGVSEPRNIRGVSTKEDEKVLKEEGIEFIKIPMPVSNDSES